MPGDRASDRCRLCHRLGPSIAALVLLASPPAPIRAAEQPQRPAPKVLHLSPRRFEQRIDARGHNQLVLRATAPAPVFGITVQFLEPDGHRSLLRVRFRTDGRAVEVGTPLAVFRVRLWGSTSRDFQLELTLR